MSDTESNGGVSRRDFLRTAGKKAAKEAVTNGANLLPGGAIVRRLLETPTDTDEVTGEEEPTEADSPTTQKKQDPFSWLAAWRTKRDNSAK